MPDFTPDLETFERRFSGRYEITSTGCWEWTGCLTKGYGSLSVNGRMTKTHRYAYELLVGPIPAGLEMDHLCRNPPCINPSHLEPVTHAENIRRSDRIGGRGEKRKILRSHCPSGHPYDEENTMHHPRGYRVCRTCRKLARARARSARRPVERYPADRTRCPRGHPWTAENTYHFQGIGICRTCQSMKDRMESRT